MNDALTWNAPELQVDSDSAWRAKYRLLQSWYRETVLDVPPGIGGRGRLVGSMLATEAVQDRPGLNFLTQEIADYVEQRIPQIQRAGGTIDVDRVRRNMLSSMPLCFNLFGYLRGHAADAAAVLGDKLGLDIATIDQIGVEDAPPADEHLGDRTAFDALIGYRTRGGQRGFLAVETKYTDEFSKRQYEAESYTRLTEDPKSGFRAGAAEHLKGRATNQVWRNALLALSLRHKGKYDLGHAVVIACRGDSGAEKAVAGLRSELVEPESLIRSVALEELVDAFVARPATKAWALEFRRRYLDLSPVL